jgi:outer membrane protein assembly factor BamB
MNHTCLTVALGTLLTLAGTALAKSPFDWPNWRGPEQNNVSRETGLPDKFEPKEGGANLLWKSEKLATRSTPIVLGDRLYTICRHNPLKPTEAEKVVCADAATGKVLWENIFNVYLSDVPGERIGWSCLAADSESGNIYVLGVSGLFQCIDGKSGKTLWKNSMHETFGLLTTYGGRTNVPVVFEDLVIISGVVIGWGEQAQPNHRFVAFDKKNGKVVWFAGTRNLPNDTNYGTPTIAVIGGQAQLIVGAGDGQVWGLQPRTGKQIWNFDLTMGGINSSPLVVGDTVYISHSEENLDGNTAGAVAALKGSLQGNTAGKGEIWRVKEIMAGRASPVMAAGQLIIADDRANLYSFDPKTGEINNRQKLGKEMRATPLVAGGKLYCVSTNGMITVLSPSQSGLRKVHATRLPVGEECYGSPIASHGRLYIPSTENLYCFMVPGHKPKADPIPEPARETPVAKDQKPAHAQIVPAEVLMRPSDKQSFTVRLYNAAGQRLADPPKDSVKFTVDGGGTITPAGELTPDASQQHFAVRVSATVNGASPGLARVRVVPDLPWKFDFESGQIPITWVGARYRHVIRKIEGNSVMVKVTTIPKGTRSQAFMGHTDFSNYTTQADVLGNVQDNKTPDIGLIAQGYILDLRGASQELQLRTWGSQMRIGTTIKFDWKPEIWYTMKIRSAVEGDKAVARGKVWPKGQKEPTDWSIELADPSPVASGSPGLWADATNAEIFLDNISVTLNN